MEINELGYPVDEKGRLIHRQIAYYNIYLKHKEKYPLPFSQYIVHHKNGNPRDFRVSNLKIMTQEKHKKLHGIEDETPLTLEQQCIENEKYSENYNSPFITLMKVIIYAGLSVLALFIICMIIAYATG